MRKSLVLLLQSLFIFMLWQGDVALAAVGRTEGAATVSDNGAAEYTIPIFTPPGIAGLTPELAFTYSSNGGNGALGVGWGVSGLSRIERCPATFAANNGNPRDVKGDAFDRFCRDGNQLKYFAGAPYGQAGAEYRTEIDTIARIKSYGAAGIGPAYFIVEQKDGLIYEYGNTIDSRIEWLGSANARTWAVNKIRDRSGNAILFNYSEDGVNGGYRINSIQYTANATQGVTPPYQISFVYEPMPSGEVDSTFMGNGLIKRMTRLDRVNVTYSGSLVRRYELTFEPSLSSTSRSRLQSIQECSGPTLDCLPATAFAYQNGTNNQYSESDIGLTLATASSAVLPLDINGDGRTDLVYPSCPGGGQGTWISSLANADGSYAPPVNSGLTTPCRLPVPIDYNLDGRQDILYEPTYSGSLYVLQGTAQGLASAPIDTGAPPGVTNQIVDAMDVNGDGRDDLVYVYPQSVQYRLRQYPPSGGFGAPVSLHEISEPSYLLSIPQRHVRDNRPDINGDGRTDLVVRVVTCDPITEACTGFLRVILTGQTASIFDIPASGAGHVSLADFNGDGLSDVAYCFTGEWRYRFSRGLSFGPEFVQPFQPATYPTHVVVADWDGDGFDDIISRFSNGSLQFTRSNGEAFQPAVSIAQLNAALAVGSLLPADSNGDGLTDFVVGTNGTTRLFKHAGVAPDLLLSVTDGFGVGTTFSFASTGNYNLFQRSSWSGFSYPTQDSSAPMYVVSNVQASNGIGGTYNLQDFSYEGARLDLTGRGFLGFAARSWVDSRTGVRQRLEYLQDFPLTGKVQKSQSTKASSGTIFNEVLTIYQTFNTGGSEYRSLLNAFRITQTDRELGGTYNGIVVRTTLTINTMDWTTGTVYDSETVITEGSNANGLNPGQTHTLRTSLPLPSMFTDTANWCIGRPGQVQQINSHVLYGGNSQTRTANASWDGLACRPTQTVIEPGNPELQVTTDLTYDAFGNLAQQTVTPVNETARVSLANWGTDGRFPRTLTNPLSQSTTVDWWPELGLLKSATDANGLIASNTYDGFGRPVTEVGPDGTSTLTEYLLCDADCTGFANTKYKIRSTFRDTGGGTISQGFVLLDAFDRVRRSSSYALEGGLINRLVEYNAAGQVYRTSTPYFSLAATPTWTTFLYDAIGRQTQATLDRASDSDGSTAMSSVQYDGLSITSTDPQGKVRVDTLSPLGQILRAIQASGTGDESQANYDYDAFGNLVRVTDALSNQSVIGYNIRGFKTSSSDPDMGNWAYSYYALGELKQQTDAKSQVTSFTYDKLSRPLTRVEPADSGSGNQTTTWIWGNSAASFNIGQLQSVTVGGYSETYTYDNRSRLINSSVVADGTTFVIGQSYNTIGQLDTLTYPASTGAAPFKVKYEYETANKSGLLQRVKDFNAGTVFWQATSTNAFGQYQDITLGNGLKTLTAFDSVTGLTNRIETGPSGGNTRQYLQYVWDKAGNLTSRQDLNISKLESFTYDNLYRLTQASVTGGSTLTVAYNAIGNITSKSDVGTYTYNSVKKHAVASAGTFTFTYDANGNAITQNGASINWTAYNLPKLISTNTGRSSTFLHGPDRQRYKQVAVVDGGLAETTLYIKGLLERVTGILGTEYRHLIVGPDGVIAVHNRRVSGTNETLYLLKDHLGSTDVISDEVGANRVKLSFNAFGARRNGATWSGPPTPSDQFFLAGTSRLAFTGHEQLDHLDLVHMNGRVYQPLVGRFLSADPFVQAPFNSQSLNRYSYVFNNPLSFTDPSGFATTESEQLCNDGCIAALFNLPFVFRGPSGSSRFQTPRPLRLPTSDPSPPPTSDPSPLPAPDPQPEPTMGPRMPPMVDMFMGGQVTRNDGEGWMNSKLLRTVASIGVGAAPVTGSIQSVVELVSGRDYITGEETSRVIAGVGLVAGFIPFGKTAAKGVSKLFGRADDVVEAAAARAVKIGASQFASIVTSASGGRALRKLQRRQGDPKRLGLFSGIALTEESAVATVQNILSNATSRRFGRLGLADFQGEKGLLFIDDAGRGVLVRQSDNSFITFIEVARGLGNIFN